MSRNERKIGKLCFVLLRVSGSDPYGNAGGNLRRGVGCVVIFYPSFVVVEDRVRLPLRVIIESYVTLCWCQ